MNLIEDLRWRGLLAQSTDEKALIESLKTFDGMKVDALLERRHERLMSYGKFKEIEAKP